MIAATAQKRRSDRILLTVPVRAEGTDSNGEAFECEARALSVNRHGARVQIPRALDQDQVVRLKNSTGDYQAEFRVVACIVPNGAANGEYGMECVDAKENFWKIDFPASEEGEVAEAKVLVECRRCESLALMPMALSELEALRAMGLVGKYCHYCNTTSLWKYAHVGMSPYLARELAKDPDHNPSNGTGPAERGHRRIYVLMPLGVRDGEGTEEQTRTENISTGGFCFASEKPYELGTPILAVFPNDSLAYKTELAARIVRKEPVKGSPRKIYGAKYDKF